jgi:hypothetical protein
MFIYDFLSKARNNYAIARVCTFFKSGNPYAQVCNLPTKDYDFIFFSQKEKGKKKGSG